MGIAEFLAARLDEDKRIAQACREQIWRLDPGWDGGVYLLEDEAGAWIAPGQEDGPHIARHDPARVLADVAAKQAIVERYRFVTEHGPARDHTRAMDMSAGASSALRDVLVLLVQPYADHPDFDPAWRDAVEV